MKVSDLKNKRTEEFASPLHETRNSLPHKVRAEMVAVLQARLSDSIDLVLQVKQAHWNVKGPQFIALHELFDKIYEEAGDYADLVAERLAQLGGSPDGTLGGTARLTTLPSYPVPLHGGMEHVAALSASFASFGEAVREAIEQSDECDDPATADIFTEISRSVDKNLWFLESHLQSKE